MESFPNSHEIFQAVLWKLPFPQGRGGSFFGSFHYSHGSLEISTWKYFASMEAVEVCIAVAYVEASLVETSIEASTIASTT